MSDWKPLTDFEDDLLAIQPECDFTFDNYMPNTLAGALFQGTAGSSSYNEDILKPEIIDKSKEAKMVSNIYNNIMPSGTLIGSRVTVDNLNNLNREAETIAMIRNTGSFSSHLEGFEKRTVRAANETRQNSVKLHRLPFPVLLDESFFKLKPSDSSLSKSLGSSENTSSTSLNSSKPSTNGESKTDEAYEIMLDGSADDSKIEHCAIDENTNKIDNIKKLKTLLKKTKSFADEIYLGDLFHNEEEERTKTVDNVEENEIEKLKNVQNDLSKEKGKGARKRGLAIRFPGLLYDEEPRTRTPIMTMGVDSNTRFYTPREIYVMKRKQQDKCSRNS